MYEFTKSRYTKCQIIDLYRIRTHVVIENLWVVSSSLATRDQTGVKNVTDKNVILVKIGIIL